VWARALKKKKKEGPYLVELHESPAVEPGDVVRR